jgi:phosphopantetheinyl transferase (holo-ACP synthase)
MAAATASPPDADQTLAWIVLVSLRKLAADATLLKGASALLQGEEVQLLARAQTAKRRLEFLGGRLAAKLAVNRCRMAAGEPELGLCQIEIARKTLGAPQVCCPGYHPAISIAHSRTWAVAMAARQPCGVDVEDSCSRVCATADYFDQIEIVGAVPSFGVRCVWAAKEAAAKATGRGLLNNPYSVRIVPAGEASDEDRIGAAAGAKGALALAVAFGT